jgi:hypothetical protein
MLTLSAISCYVIESGSEFHLGDVGAQVTGLPSVVHIVLSNCQAAGRRMLLPTNTMAVARFGRKLVMLLDQR